MKKLVFACAAAVMAVSATTLTTSPALAEASQVEIDTAPYNLRSQAGRDALAGRIASAGRDVCGDATREIKANRAFQACRDAAVSDGMAQLSALSRGGAVQVGAD
ncbi:MAG: UrcA family protein [Parasphingopyxis sp.]|nr:UrcA family protein [Sphingomonadales bacterium]